MSTPGRWRPLVAVLANPETRRVAAELMLGATLDRATGGLSPSRRRHITQSLVNSGLIDRESHEFRPDLFRSLLDSSATPKREGVERFMVGDRITQYPASLQVRGELLAHIARTAFDAANSSQRPRSTAG